MQRINLLQKKLKEKKIEAFITTHRPNLKYFCNFSGTRGTLLITPKTAYFLTDSRYFDEAKKIIPKNVKPLLIDKKFKELQNKFIDKLKIKMIHFEENYTTVARLKSYKKQARKIRFKGTVNLCEELKMVKEPDEIKLLEKSQRINETVLKEVLKHLKIGITEFQIASLIRDYSHKFGADELSFSPIVCFGKMGAVPHHEPSNIKLKKGDSILIDMGMKYKGYCSDMSRTFFFKLSPTKQQEKIYNLVLESQEKAIKKMRAGMTGKQIDSLSRNDIEKAGFGDKYTHAGGHGIGLEIHEIPSLSQEYKGKFPENCVVTVEPGIYIENFFGVRIEDMVILGRTGVKNLTRFPKDLKSAIIK